MLLITTKNQEKMHNSEVQSFENKTEVLFRMQSSIKKLCERLSCFRKQEKCVHILSKLSLCFCDFHTKLTESNNTQCASQS